MMFEQTVEIPDNHRLTLEIPDEVPAGRAQVFIQFPVLESVQVTDRRAGESVPLEARGRNNNEIFRNAIRNAYGAWKDNPWKNHLEDINAMRNEWEHRDSWNPDPAKRHQN
jgi:hypothetical protein